jgi:TolB protein
LRLPLALTVASSPREPPPPAQAAFPGANGRISFSSQGDLWSVEADGTDPRALTRTADVEEAQSAFSPDGTRIAYRRRPPPARPSRSTCMAADGSDQRRISASTVNETQPAWSADGSRIVFRRSVVGDQKADFWSMRADGTDRGPLVTTPDADERYPVASPDGTRLAFTSDRDGQYELYVGRGGRRRRTARHVRRGLRLGAVWSPDGTQLAFERGAALDVDATKDIWRMAADGGAQVRLTPDDDVVDEGPAFSPDGTQIAFTSSRDGNYEAYRMAADGAAPTRVVARPGTKEESPDWQPVPPSPPGTTAPPAEPNPVSAPLAEPAPAAQPTPAADRDRDGLTAARERVLRTSEADRDTDDDGLSDGREATRTRTSAHRRDTDRDGLPDGVELGVRRPVADPPGPVRGTDRARFRRDADPRSRTDPRRRDTDRDGRADGREDRDRDGRRDPGESDPRA